MPDWFFYALITLLVWSFFGLFPKLAASYIDPRSFLVYQVLGSLLVATLALVMLGFRPQWHLRGVALALLTGASGSIGTLFFLLAMQKGKASVVVVMTGLYPVLTVLMVCLLLKETLTLKQIIGMVLGLIAILLFTI